MGSQQSKAVHSDDAAIRQITECLEAYRLRDEPDNEKDGFVYVEKQAGGVSTSRAEPQDRSPRLFKRPPQHIFKKQIALWERELLSDSKVRILIRYVGF
jgi:hypothetical protein